MYLIVLLLAVFIISISLSIIIVPATVRGSIQMFLKKKWLWPVSALRLMLGAAFMLGAEETSMPLLVSIIGVVLIVAGISLPIIGHSRIENLGNYILGQKDWVLRICGFVGLLFGISLAMAGLPV